MDLSSLLAGNSRALRRPISTEVSVIDAGREFPYRGFIQVAIENAEPFLMFSNHDDIVAQHYLFHGADAFESYSLRLWTYFAKSARVTYDIGSFTGVFSLAAIHANPSLKALAFEPSINTFARLVTNVLANGAGGRIGTLKLALGDSNTQMTLKHPAGIHCLGSEESLVDGHNSSVWFEELVDVARGDTLSERYSMRPRDFVIEVNPAHVDLIKIDVEGSEPAVLKGLLKTLQANLPTLIIECLDLKAFQDVWQVLSPLGYSYRYIDDDAGELYSDQQRFVRTRTRNVLFFDREERLAGVPRGPRAVRSSTPETLRSPETVVSSERIEAALVERDSALTALAAERAETNALRLRLQNLGEPTPPNYPASAGVGPPPLRYVLADRINELVNGVKPVHRLLKSALKTLNRR